VRVRACAAGPLGACRSGPTMATRNILPLENSGYKSPSKHGQGPPAKDKYDLIEEAKQRERLKKAAEKEALRIKEEEEKLAEWKRARAIQDAEEAQAKKDKIANDKAADDNKKTAKEMATAKEKAQKDAVEAKVLALHMQMRPWKINEDQELEFGDEKQAAGGAASTE